MHEYIDLVISASVVFLAYSNYGWHKIQAAQSRDIANIYGHLKQMLERVIARK